jgi:hypothetical protein
MASRPPIDIPPEMPENPPPGADTPDHPAEPDEPIPTPDGDMAG